MPWHGANRLLELAPQRIPKGPDRRLAYQSSGLTADGRFFQPQGAGGKGQKSHWARQRQRLVLPHEG